MMKKLSVLLFATALVSTLSYSVFSVQKSYYSDGTAIIYEDNYYNNDSYQNDRDDAYSDPAPLHQVHDTQSYLRQFSPRNLPDEFDDSSPRSIYMPGAYSGQ